MCGRYFISQAPEVFAAFFGYPDRPNFPPRYNIAPTQPVPIVLREEGVPRFRLVRWGFLPGFVKDPRGFPLLINARAETLLEKPAFRHAVRRRRCVFLADGFYEWSQDGARRPHLVARVDGRPLAMAGLWETWSGPDGSEIDTAAIVTCGANGLLAAVHERMPVILGEAAVAAWLDVVGVEATEAAALARPCPEDWLDLRPVTRRVNDARHDDPGVQAPPEPGEATAAAAGRRPRSRRAGST